MGLFRERRDDRQTRKSDPCGVVSMGVVFYGRDQLAAMYTNVESSRAL
jgi:hypothetical protein